MASEGREQLTPDDARRLRAEAEAQNARILREGSEPRDKFYFLIDKAFQAYYSTIGPVRGLRVLVAGCSEGAVLAMARNGAIVTGIDISEEAIRKIDAGIEARGLSDVANVRVMNAEQLEWPPETFDLIVCTGVLHHLDVNRATASWSRALKATGRVIMIEPMAWNPAAAVYRTLTPSMRTADEHPLKPNDIRLLKDRFGHVVVNGFALTSTISVLWAVVPDPFSMKLRWRNTLDKLDRALMTRLPSLKYFAWTSVIECAQPKQAQTVTR